jgi:hypothetical protein
MIGDTIAITHDGNARTLVKVNQDGYGADYYLAVPASNLKYYIEVRHTVPKSKAITKSFPESHMMKLKIEYTGDTTDSGLFRTDSVWGVIRTDNAGQISSDSVLATAAFLTAFSTTNTTKMIGRES